MATRLLRILMLLGNFCCRANFDSLNFQCQFNFRRYSFNFVVVPVRSFCFLHSVQLYFTDSLVVFLPVN